MAQKCLLNGLNRPIFQFFHDPDRQFPNPVCAGDPQTLSSASGLFQRNLQSHGDVDGSTGGRGISLGHGTKVSAKRPGLDLWILSSYFNYYHNDRTHCRLGKDTPSGRPAQPKPDKSSKIIELPRVGGLHHRYEWRQAT
jgi:hypothetical protein